MKNNAEIIAELFYKGIKMANSQKVYKKDEKELMGLCKQLEENGAIESAEELFIAIGK